VRAPERKGSVKAPAVVITAPWSNDTKSLENDFHTERLSPFEVSGFEFQF
jgi:hypothetical protein